MSAEGCRERRTDWPASARPGPLGGKVRYDEPMIDVGREIRLYAHRGHSARMPENTLAAFRSALAEGADALELDVHRTADGHFVVSHDRTGMRVAGVAERIEGSTLDDVRRWRVHGPRADDVRPEGVPTLTEVLEAFPGTPMSVDLKPRRRGDVPYLLELIRRHQAEPRVTLASFHEPIVRRMRRLGYAGPTTLTHSEVVAVRLLPAALARLWVRGQAAQVPVRGGGVRLDTRRFIRRCRTLGLRVDYWVVNDPHAAHRLLERGATGLMTDDPVRLAPVVRAARGRGRDR